jgi:hypothetical protein
MAAKYARRSLVKRPRRNSESSQKEHSPFKDQGKQAWLCHMGQTERRSLPVQGSCFP